MYVEKNRIKMKIKVLLRAIVHRLSSGLRADPSFNDPEFLFDIS